MGVTGALSERMGVTGALSEWPEWMCSPADQGWSIPQEAVIAALKMGDESWFDCYEGSMEDVADLAEQFEKHLNCAKQIWLLGAGVSCESNVPLMYPLTDRALHLAENERFAEDDDAKSIISYIRSDIGENDHIEIFLTHLSDLISLAERSRNNRTRIGEDEATREKLIEVHVGLLSIISEIVRWGYRPAVLDQEGSVASPEASGEAGNSIVEVEAHCRFVDAVFGSRRAGLEGLRPALEFFTTNYDTLMEDALALRRIPFEDGFIGGGLGYWNASFDNDRTARARVTKLHGSVDWYRSAETPSPLLRIRHGDCYPPEGGAVMIYPQATKYLNAQQDPFSDLFQRFRTRLADNDDSVLFTCGYSFGDAHIDAEIERALSAERSQLTVIAFSSEPGGNLPPTLRRWSANEAWKNRIFVAAPSGLYHGNEGPFFEAEEGERDWWKFDGVTTLMKDGLPADVQEKTL